MASQVRRVLGEKDGNVAMSPSKRLGVDKTVNAAHASHDPSGASTNASAHESKKRPHDEQDTAVTDASDAHSSKRVRPDHVFAKPAEPTLMEFVEAAQAAQTPSRPSLRERAPVPAVSKEDAPQADDQPSQTSTIAESMPDVSSAEILRLRLRVAMYKVRTDQISAPLSRLEISPPATPSTDPKKPKEKLEIRDPPEGAYRWNRRMLSPDMRKTYQARGLMKAPAAASDMPVAAKSSYAPHNAGARDQTAEKRTYGPVYMHSSSEPCSDCEGDEVQEQRPRGPATPPVAADRTALSSPEGYGPISVPKLPQSAVRAAIEGSGPDLTSSAVKGHAADSLLRLGGGS